MVAGHVKRQLFKYRLVLVIQDVQLLTNPEHVRQFEVQAIQPRPPIVIGSETELLLQFATHYVPANDRFDPQLVHSSELELQVMQLVEQAVHLLDRL